MIVYFLGQEKPEWFPHLDRYLPKLQPDGTYNDPKHDHEHGVSAAAMYELVVALNAKAVLELGTRMGKSTGILLVALERTGGHLYSMDINDCDVSTYVPGGASPQLTKIVSDDRLYAWDIPVDMVLIDSSHLYDHTKEQMTKYWPHVKTPGVMVLSDTDSHFSQKRAVQDWAEEMRLSYVFDTRGQGGAYFFKPVYGERCRDRVTVDRWETGV